MSSEFVEHDRRQGGEREGVPAADVAALLEAANGAPGFDRATRFDAVRGWIAEGSVLGAYRALLGSWFTPHPGWSRSERVLYGCAMPHAATARGRDGEAETHLGVVDVTGSGASEVPALWSHGGTPLGRLVAYRQGARGSGSLDVWVEVDGSQRGDDVLDLADCGRVGLSVGVAGTTLGEEGSSRVIDAQRLREVSLTPVERAAFGAATRVHLRPRRPGSSPSTAPSVRPRASGTRTPLATAAACGLWVSARSE